MSDAAPAVAAAAPRILIVDDNRAIHEDFRKIFGAIGTEPPTSAAELALFGGAPRSPGAAEFRVDSAYQGQEGTACVRLAQQQHDPYAVAFVDVRMPPGWDGIETAAQMWRHDPDVQIVICTAYSDYSWSEMLDKLGRSDRLVILKKPFDTIEVVQLAAALSEKWRLARQSRSILESLERRVADRTGELVRTVAELRASEGLKRAILESSLDCVVTMDHEGKVVEFNAAAEATFGVPCERAIGKLVADLMIPSRLRDAHQGGFTRYLATGESRILGKRLELQAVRADGSEFPIEMAITATGGTSEPMFTAFIRDISARRDADRKIRRLNRVYAVLSAINALIVRVGERHELFREASRIAVEHGGFRMAWIGIVDAQAGVVEPVASAGDVRDFFASAPLAVTENKPGGHGLSGRAVREKKAMISNDVRNDPQRMMRRELEERGINSLAVIPLVAEGEAIGVLALYAAEVGFFDADEMRLLEDLAGDISFAVAHLEKTARLARITRVGAMLSAVNAAIVRIRSRQPLFEEACRIAVETGGLRYAWLGVVDEAEGRVRQVAGAGAEDGLRAKLPALLSVRDGEDESRGIAAQAVRAGHALVVNDVHGDARIKLKPAAGVKSLAALPLCIAGRPVGVFVLHAQERGFFDEDEMRLLQEMAANISFAVEHMEKEEKVHRLTRVHAMLSGINGAIVRIRDRQELFAEACRIGVETGGLVFTWLCVVDEAGERLRPVASAGPGDGFLELIRGRFSLRDDAPEGHGIGARAVRDGCVLVVNDIQAANLKYKQAHADRGIKSAAAFPLFVAGRIVAVFGLHAGKVGFFDADELKLLNEVAGNIAFAIDHIDQQERLAALDEQRKFAEVKVRRLNRVHAVLSGITTLIVHVHEREELFREACRIAVEDGNFAMAWIGQLDPATEDVTPVAWAGEAAEALTRDKSSARADSPLGAGAVGQSIRARRPVFNNNTLTQGFAGPRLQEIVRLGFQSHITLPLYEGEAVAGTLTLYSRERDYFDAEEVRLLTGLAGEISFALDNIRRQQKLAKLARIRAVSSEINAAIVRIHDREALLRETCRIAAEHGRFELVWIALIHPDEQRIEPLAWVGFSSESARGLGRPVPAGTLSEVIETRKLAVRHDIQRGGPAGSLRVEAVAKGFRSTVCVPFTVDGKVVAAVIIFAPEPGFFDAEELALLDEAAANVSFALAAIEKQARLDYVAYYDALTGLANRTLFLERMSQLMRSAAAAGHPLALFMIDLERFKNINDSLGRPAGDALLIQVAQWLAANVGDPTLLARVGADHFAVMLPRVTHVAGVAKLVAKAAGKFLEHPFPVGEAVLRVALKVGIAIAPEDGADADTLFRNAEAALKKAKARGDRFLFYNQDMTDAVAGKLALETQLREALDKGEFVLHYQPKVCLGKGKLTSAEALIRWNDPRSGLVPPGRFIPILEETGLIHDVGRWALRKAIEDYLGWLARGLPAVRVAVNVSPLQLRDAGFVDEVKRAVAIHPAAAAGLELEITESLIMEDVQRSIATLSAIRALGVTIAIDDFGTGFSSLSHLARLPVDTLKIDRSFVVDMTAGPQGLSLVSTIISLAHSLKLKVVAEGVETEEQSRLLRLLGAEEMQGYLFSKPVPAEVFEARFLSAPEPAALPA